MKYACVLGGGGFIGGHLARRLKNDGFWVRVVDIKDKHDFFDNSEICDEYCSGDLRDSNFTSRVLYNSKGTQGFDEVYQLAADMGGAGYIFTGENDANVMHNSASINLNVVYWASKLRVLRIFYSSSACIYPEYNQRDPQNPECSEESAYPANPDSEYGWEKLFSERLFLSFNRNYNLDVRVARYHNVYGPYGTYKNGKEKAPAAMCRKVIECVKSKNDSIEVWGLGNQTRSFLYINDCIEMTLKFMRQDKFMGPVNIGSEEMVTINELASLAVSFSKHHNISIHNIFGDNFFEKYNKKCPVGVAGRNSDNKLYKQYMNYAPQTSLKIGMEKTYKWILKQL
jgi:nucleoside-diphosphate-sugar epimerase